MKKVILLGFSVVLLLTQVAVTMEMPQKELMTFDRAYKTLSDTSVDSEKKIAALDYLLGILTTLNNPSKELQAILLLWKYRNEEKYNEKIRFIFKETAQGKAIAQGSHNNGRYIALEKLFKESIPQDKIFASSIYRKIAKDSTDSHRYEALLALFTLSTEDDKKFARLILREIAKDSNNPHRYNILYMLLTKGNAEDAIFVRPVLREMAQDPNNPHRYNALLTLFTLLTEDDKKFARSILREIANNPYDKDYFYALMILFTTERSENEDKNFARPLLRELASNKSNYAKLARQILLTNGNEEDRNFVRKLPK